MKSKYLADMSHEIRTPLNAITGFSELMAFADTDEERMSYYDVIKMNNQLLMQLINDILDISKIEADAIKITYEQLDVSEWIRFMLPPSYGFREESSWFWRKRLTTICSVRIACVCCS